MRFQDVNSICNELLRQREALVVEQLKGLVDKGLLVLKLGESMLIQAPGNPNGFELRQSVSLELRDAEHMAKLEQENAELKKRIESVAKALSA